MLHYLCSRPVREVWPLARVPDVEGPIAILNYRLAKVKSCDLLPLFGQFPASRVSFCKLVTLSRCKEFRSRNVIANGGIRERLKTILKLIAIERDGEVIS